MNAVIRIRLTETGRKASIMAGGDGADIQTITLTTADPLFAAIVAAGSVTNNGVVWDRTFPYDGNDRLAWSFDAMPTAQDVFDRRDKIAADQAAKEAADAAERREKTLAVLAARKIRNDTAWIAGGSYKTVGPDWPYSADNAITTSPEALAWVAELDAANAAAKTVAETALAEKKAATEAEAARKAAANEAFRIAMGLAEGDVAYRIEDGALAGVPCWESHKRGKNWMAVIETSPSSPGGLARDFATKAKGDLYYILPSLNPGDAVEWGADYYTGGGSKRADRWYGYVVDAARAHPSNGNSYLVVHKCATGKAACKEGKEFAKELAMEKTSADAATMTTQAS
jgi:hypothetical protein